jgi:DNA-binding transcriptional MerR regulator
LTCVLDTGVDCNKFQKDRPGEWKMRVNKVAEMLEISVGTVRYYTRIRFIKPSKDYSNGYKNYSQADVQRLRFIISARHLGFTVEDISKILGDASKGKTACPLVRKLIEQRLAEIEQRFKETQMLLKRMKAALRDWEGKPDKAPTGHMVCHLIEET